MQPASNKTKISQLLLECTDRTAYIRRPGSDFVSRKERWWRCYIEFKICFGILTPNQTL